MEIIKTKKLTKYYGKSRGIIELDLSVKQGEIFGFIGPNGAGKSTTIRTLLGLISASSGSAEIFGKNVPEYKTQILSDIGYMPSEASFYTGMKVSDILSLSAKLHKKDCTASANALCERLCLDTAKKVEELSLGNRKKVGIVCALQHDPSLYIFDEPTSALDPLMQKEFFDILQEKNKNGATIFLSSHVLSEIQRYCTTAAIIRKGKLIACDSVANLAKTSAKKISVSGAKDIQNIDGAKNISTIGETTSFLYNGDINALIIFLSTQKITDLSITEPDLEEIFMHLYEGEENSK